MNKIWRYKVIGRGYFPFDMLRYDRCWPATESNSISLGNGRTDQPIEITGYSKPTVDRWKSFGWNVIDIREGL